MVRALAGAVLALLVGVACGAKEAARPAAAAAARRNPSGEQQDAEALGREIFELVDRALDYRGSHRGRPATSLRQMGADSLTPSTARTLINLAREPVVTVSFRRIDNRATISCRGDGQILEEASLNGGSFTVMCTSRTGVQRPIRVDDPADR